MASNFAPLSLLKLTKIQTSTEELPCNSGSKQNHARGTWRTCWAPREAPARSVARRTQLL